MKYANKEQGILQKITNNPFKYLLVISIALATIIGAAMARENISILLELCSSLSNPDTDADINVVLELLYIVGVSIILLFLVIVYITTIYIIPVVILLSPITILCWISIRNLKNKSLVWDLLLLGIIITLAIFLTKIVWTVAIFESFASLSEFCSFIGTQITSVICAILVFAEIILGMWAFIWMLAYLPSPVAGFIIGYICGSINNND